MKITLTQALMICAGIALVPVAFFNVYHYLAASPLPDHKACYNLGESILIDYAFSLSVTFSICITSAKSFPFFNKKWPWSETNAVKRIVYESLYLIVLSGSLMAGITLIFYYSFYSHVDSLNLPQELFANVMTAVIITVITASIWEAVALFKSWRESELVAERLSKEHIQSQFQTLKNQVNPHFLFNSLNALSSLVHSDPDKAEQFIDEFAKIYRYVLDVKERKFVELKEELRFLESFMFLQQIRFGDHLRLELEVDAARLHDFLPPLALQELIENAIKHNEVSGQHPLTIRVESKDGSLEVSNGLQPRKEDVASTGTGLKNLKERYRLFADKEPEFVATSKQYIAKLPLIEAE